MLVLLASLIGGYLNIPIARLPEAHVVTRSSSTAFGVPYLVPQIVDWPGTILAVNVGGALIPILLSLYLVVHNRILVLSAVATVVVAVVVHQLATPIPGVGISVPLFAPPLVAALIAVLLSRRYAAPLAYVGGSLGVLIGADLTNLDQLQTFGRAGRLDRRRGNLRRRVPDRHRRGAAVGIGRAAGVRLDERKAFAASAPLRRLASVMADDRARHKSPASAKPQGCAPARPKDGQRTAKGRLAKSIETSHFSAGDDRAPENVGEIGGDFAQARGGGRQNMSDARNSDLGGSSDPGLGDVLSTAASDSFSETTTTSWLQRIINSFIGALIGLVLIIASIVAIFWNEGGAINAARALAEGAGPSSASTRGRSIRSTTASSCM